MKTAVMASRPEDKVHRDTLDAGLIGLLDKDEIIPLDLYTSCLIGDYQVVRQCIRDGINIDRPNCCGWTPLIYAAYVGKDTVVNLLLESGVKVDATVESTGMNAMMYAASCGNESVVYFLLQQGANINARDRKGRTSIFLAAHCGHVNVVKILLDQNADTEIGDYESGNTPLMETAVEGYEVIFSLLMEMGGNIEAKNKSGETPRSLAIRFGNTMIVNLIDDRTRANKVSPVRSEAWLNDGGNTKLSLLQGYNEGVHVTSKVVKDAWPQSQAFQSYPPRTGKGGPLLENTEAAKTHDQAQALTIRDMVAPIDLSDHDQPSHDFYSLGSDTADRQMLNQRCTDGDSVERLDNGSKPVDREDKKESLHIDRGVHNVAPGRISPRLNKPSRVYTELPVNVHGMGPKVESYPGSLSELFQNMNLTKYLSCFEHQGIDLSSFLTFSDDDLKEIGVDKLGPRKKMLSAIQRFGIDSKTSRDMKIDRMQQDQTTPQDLLTQLHQAHALIKKLETELHKEQITRTEMEAYFVSEQARITRVMHLAAETKRDCEDALKNLKGARSLQMDISERLHTLKEESRLEDAFPVNESQKNIVDVQRSLEGQLVTLNTNLTVAGKQVDQILEVLQAESLSS